MPLRFSTLLLVLLLACPPLLPTARAYAVLTHQANVDSAWTVCIAPALRRFAAREKQPALTDDQLREAHAYAYGGAIIQDMGYYPFGAKLFTNLTHYVRTGAFVRALLTQAENLNEYAFALGALAHYAADNQGHSKGTNRAMASVYPELKKKFGPVITYEDAPFEHTQVEFSFDVVQVAAGRYRPQAFHDFIGFQVAKPVLERAFRQTYGLELGAVFVNTDLAIGSYRFAVSQLMPTLTRAAWHYQQKEINKLSRTAKRRDVVYRYSERTYRREFGRRYERPHFGARLLSGVFRVLPKIGPLRPFRFRVPTQEAEDLLRASFREVRARYCALLAEQEGNDHPPLLPDRDFDTGKITAPGEYGLTDRTYSELLIQLDKNDFAYLTPALRADLLRFFQAGVPKLEQEKDQTHAQEALAHLRAMP